MIQIQKPEAMRTALVIAKGANAGLQWVRLDPDGTLWATDGVALIRSLGAHTGDIQQTLYVSAPEGYRPNGNETGYQLDVSECLLKEERPRSSRDWTVRVSRDVSYPAVAKVIPNHLQGKATTRPDFDSIIGGRLAEAYGLQRGVWVAGAHKDRVYLQGVEEGDAVILAGLKSL